MSLSQLTSLCQSVKSEEAARNCSTPPEVSWHISFYGVLTNGAQLCSIRLTNMCMSLVKNPSPCVLFCVCFSRTSFYLCLLQWNISSMFAPAKHHPTQLTFPRTLKFPLQGPLAATGARTTSWLPHICLFLTTVESLVSPFSTVFFFCAPQATRT